jgi:glutaredoxin
MAAEVHTVSFYGLSTCVHCRHAREFLEKHHVPFTLHYVDLAEGEERSQLLKQVREYNSGISFPTIVIDNAKVIIGFQPDVLLMDLDL